MLVLFSVAGVALVAVLGGLLTPGPVNGDIMGRDFVGMSVSTLAVLVMITVIAREAYQGINPELHISRLRQWAPFVGTAAIFAGGLAFLVSR